MRAVMVAVCLGWASLVQAQDTGSAFTLCSSKQNDQERLACFDTAVKQQAASAPTEPVSNTKQIVAVSPTTDVPKPESFRLIDSEDLYVAPNKYIDRPVELRKMRCFHADKNEYRCVAPGSTMLVVIVPQITPQAEQDAVENDCGEIKKMSTSPKCVKTLRFVPAKAGEDIVNGYQKRQVIVARSLEIVPAAASKRR